MKLHLEQEEIINQLSKELQMTESQIVSALVEFGMAYMIAWRKGKEDESIKLMSKKLEENPLINRMSQRIEYFYNNG